MKALGMIETKGLIGAIVAADVAVKTADVQVLNKHFISAGIVTIEITGDIGAIKVAVEAAVEAVKKLGVFMSSNVIARPSDSIPDILSKVKVVESIELPKIEIKKNKIDENVSLEQSIIAKKDNKKENKK